MAELDRGTGEDFQARQPDDADPEGLRQSLGRCHPDPEPGEEPGAEIDSHQMDIPRAKADPGQEILHGRGQGLDVAAPTTQRECRLGPALGAHGHPDGLGRRLDGHDVHGASVAGAEDSARATSSERTVQRPRPPRPPPQATRRPRPRYFRFPPPCPSIRSSEY